jgi:hypothetical protein
MNRDFAVELRAVIDAETAGGSYASRVVATHIVEKLRATDPDLLNGWLNAQAETFVWQAINDRDRSLRSHARGTNGRSAFARDAADHVAGDSTGLGRWLATPFAVAGGLRKRLAVMTRDDLLFASGAYEDRAAANRMTATFLAALARKVRQGTVADHFGEDQLAAMWQSLSGKAAA